MKPFSSRFFRDSVTLFASIEDSDGDTGTPTVSWPGSGTPLTCRAEAATGSSTNARRGIQTDAVESVTGWTLAFQSDPGCRLEDKFVLTSGNRALIALGAARQVSMAGSTVLYLVDCEERS